MREDQYYNMMPHSNSGLEYFQTQLILHLRLEHQMSMRDIAKRMNMKMKEVATILEGSLV